MVHVKRLIESREIQHEINPSEQKRGMSNTKTGIMPERYTLKYYKSKKDHSEVKCTYVKNKTTQNNKK